MKTPLLFITVLFTASLAYPTLAQRAWCEGTIILTTGIKLRGQLSHRPDTDVVLFRPANQTAAWRTYSVDQLQRFSYVTNDRLHHFAIYETLTPTGDTHAILFEELIAGATVPLLQLTTPKRQLGAAKHSLPQPSHHGWQTEKPWYVWVDGRLVAPDTFVETELDALLLTLPASVQQWAARYPRPANPKALARWLAYFEREMAASRTTPVSNPTVAAWGAVR